MQRIPDAGDDNFGLKKIIRKYIENFANQVHTVLGYVVEPADERADIGCPGLGGKKRLKGREYQRYICLHTFEGQCLDGPEAHCGHRDFHDDVRVYCGKLPGFPQHTLEVATHTLGAHRTLCNLTYLLDMLLKSVPAGDSFLCYQAGVG